MKIDFRIIRSIKIKFEKKIIIHLFRLVEEIDRSFTTIIYIERRMKKVNYNERLPIFILV